MMCHRAIESAGFGKLARSVRCFINSPLRKSERGSPSANLPPPCTLHSLGPETNRYNDWRHTRLQTTAWPDFSFIRVVCNNSKTMLKVGRGCSGWTSDKYIRSKSQCHFLRSCQNFKKIRKAFSRDCITGNRTRWFRQSKQ